MHIEHEITIQAPVSAVWAATVDVESWPTLSPTTMRRVERLDDGPLRPGSRARVEQPGQRPTVWTVTTVERDRLFEWGARVYGMQMVARHRLEPVEGGCRNVLSIDITGRGSAVFGRLIRRPIARVIATENDCFRAHAESRSDAGTHAGGATADRRP